MPLCILQGPGLYFCLIQSNSSDDGSKKLPLRVKLSWEENVIGWNPIQKGGWYDRERNSIIEKENKWESEKAQGKDEREELKVIAERQEEQDHDDDADTVIMSSDEDDYHDDGDDDHPQELLTSESKHGMTIWNLTLQKYLKMLKWNSWNPTGTTVFNWKYFKILNINKWFINNDFLILINYFLILINHFLILINGMIS